MGTEPGQLFLQTPLAIFHAEAGLRTTTPDVVVTILSYIRLTETQVPDILANHRISVVTCL